MVSFGCKRLELLSSAFNEDLKQRFTGWSHCILRLEYKCAALLNSEMKLFRKFWKSICQVCHYSRMKAKNKKQNK